MSKLLVLITLALMITYHEIKSKENTPGETKVKHNSAYEDLGKYKIYEGDLNTLSAVNIRNAKLTLITDQLVKPWAFEFIDEKQIIINEVGGKIKLLNLENQTVISLKGMPHILTNEHQIGLLDIEIHPDFKNNKKIFFSYSKHDSESKNYFKLAVSSAVIEGDRLTSVKTIFEDNPFTWSPSNFGGALEFDADGLLYIATGDRSESHTAQQTDILQGKILRVKEDGTAAPNNPFANIKGIDNRIFALGVRNPQGLHFDTNSETMFEAEHGPMGGDEINIIHPGANYGWPYLTYGISYTGKIISEATHNDLMTQPIFYYLPSEAYSPLTVYRGTMFREWDGDILVGALKGKHISKVDFDNGLIRSEVQILNEINDRIRDIKVAHDGSIFILSQNGELNRLYRDDDILTITEDKPDGAFIYQLSCSGCHDIGAYDSPVLGNELDWKDILKQPISLTYKNTIEGINSMPPKGYCNICTDQHLKDAVDYMLQQVKKD